MTTPSSFEEAVKFVLEREGGYVNDPVDPGGETNLGISKRKYPDEDIKNLSTGRAKELYFIDYWQKFSCDSEPWPMNVVIFDTAVNMHPSVVAGLRKDSSDWVDFLLRRLLQYVLIVRKNKSLLKFLPNWVVRIYHLYRFVKKRGA